VAAVFLTDFGLARAITTGSKYTRTGDALGTPAYMSPEQARGDTTTLTPAADMWSLGCVCYELVAGRRAFAGETPAEVIGRVLSARPPRVRHGRPDIPAAVEHLVAAALAKVPGARPRDAGAWRDDCDRILAGMSPEYFKKAIADYAAARRPSPEMEPFAKMVKLLGVDDVAGYFAAQPREQRSGRFDQAAVANGRKASVACAACHGDDGRGDERRGVPRLMGQPAGYLRNQMLLFKADKRSPGDADLMKMKTLMKTLMKSVDDATLADLAAYYASLGR